jgi:peptidoglycan/xylan/chitin deacetylase (PgdA/CDA1 family)
MLNLKKLLSVMNIIILSCFMIISGCEQSPEDAPPPRSNPEREKILKQIDDTWEELGYSEKPAKYIALSFDDGPSAQTQVLMDALAEQKVYATFFLIGSNVNTLPGIVRDIRDAGHEIGNHSQGYASLNADTVGPVTRNIQSCNDEIFNATSAEGDPVVPKYFRAPGLSTSKNLLTACREMNFPLVHGIICNEASKVLDAATEWGIILNHDPSSDPGAAAAVPVYVAELRARGYYIVTVSQLLALRDAGELTPGKIYNDFVTVP